MRAINKDKILYAYIIEPYENKDKWNQKEPHGWLVVLIFGYLPNGDEIKKVVTKESKEDCIELIKSFGFILI
jgi:hypothetical protein